MRSSRSDAVFRSPQFMPATQSRWAGADQMIYQGTVISGQHIGKSLNHLSTDTLQQLLSQATKAQDQATLQAHIAKRTGPQPGAPADQ